VGVLYLIKAVICFFISINAFKNIYPLDANLWDSLVFILTELFCSLLIGYSRYRQEHKNIEKFNFDSYDNNVNKENAAQNRMEDEDWMNLNDPLLDKKELNIFKE
jgi:hypothetical protein